MNIGRAEDLIEELTENILEVNEEWDELMDVLRCVPVFPLLVLISVLGLPFICIYLVNKFDEWRVRRLVALVSASRNRFFA